jgi:hypothetical protein
MLVDFEVGHAPTRGDLNPLKEHTPLANFDVFLKSLN